MKIGSEYYFYHNDHLGTPQKMTAVNGLVVWAAKYSSFGKAEVDPASTVENNLRFAGQYEDAETRLHYNYHRYYDPNTSRYLTPDPIGLEGGINLFVYSLNNPINRIDPLGLYTKARREGDPAPRCSSPRLCAIKGHVSPTYCGTYAKAIACTTDLVQISSIAVTIGSGGTATPATTVVNITATVVEVLNGIVTYRICGPSLSHATSLASQIPGPPWWQLAINVLDAAVTLGE